MSSLDKLARVNEFEPTLTEAMTWLFAHGGPKVDPNATRFVRTVALQESGLFYRAQIGGGPARGFWQFEQGGGVTGVLLHPASKKAAAAICNATYTDLSPAAVWRTIEGHDVLAASFARLFLYTDARPLPTTEDEAWETYLRVWRPGKPRPADWSENWATIPTE